MKVIERCSTKCDLFDIYSTCLLCAALSGAVSQQSSEFAGEISTECPIIVGSCGKCSHNSNPWFSYWRMESI